MDELDFVKAQLARLPTRRDQAFVPLKIMFGSAFIGAALVILWLEAFWRLHVPCGEASYLWVALAVVFSEGQ